MIIVKLFGVTLMEIRISGFQGGIPQRTENTAKNSLSGISPKV